jgi:hypothetical protein
LGRDRILERSYCLFPILMKALSLQRPISHNHIPI